MSPAGSGFPLGKVPGASALSELERLRTEGRVHGYFPVLFGDPDGDLERYEIDPALFQHELEQAEHLDVARWFQQRQAADPEYYTPDSETEANEAFKIGAGDGAELTAHLDMLKKNRPKPEVVIGQVPVKEAWHLPIYLQFGGWNDCPYPAELAAVARAWQEQYGAELIALTRDTMEFVVARPPVSEEDCRQLAWQHFLLCSDIVHQGTDTVTALASSLSGARTWFFWWD